MCAVMQWSLINSNWSPLSTSLYFRLKTPLCSLVDILGGIPFVMKLSLEPRIWISGDYSNPASEIFATKKSICSKPKPSQIFTLPRLREQKSQVDCKLVQKHGSIFLRERTFDSIHWKLINYLIIAGFKSQKYTCGHFGKINYNWSSSIDYWPPDHSVKSLTLALNLEMIFWCKLIFDCLIFIEFWHQTEPGLTERRGEMTKHQLECIRQPRQRPQPPTVTSETSVRGAGVTRGQSEAELGAHSQSDAGHWPSSSHQWFW